MKPTIENFDSVKDALVYSTYWAVGATIATAIFIFLFVRAFILLRANTKQNEADHEIHVARTAAAVKERDIWKDEATKLAVGLQDMRAERNGANASYKAANMELSAAKGALNSVREELETVTLDRDELEAHRAEDLKEIEQLTAERDELAKERIDLAEMVRNLTGKLAETNEALETASTILDEHCISKRGKGARDASGKFIKVTTTVDEQKEYVAEKVVRSVKDLGKDEAILVNNEAERDGILKLMEAEGLVWRDGSMPLGFTFDEYPNWIGLSDGRIVKNCDLSEHILPASDFIPAEQPAPTPVKQLSEVNAEKGYTLPAATFSNGGQIPAHGNEKKEEALKIGDWIKGERHAVGLWQEGEITEFSIHGRPRVNGWWLNTETCLRVPRPVEVQPTEETRPDDSHAGEQVAPAEMPPAAEPFDPTKYKAFPSSYRPEDGKEINAIIVADLIHVGKGTIGKIVGDGSRVPRFVCSDNVRCRYVYIFDMAPLDPRQHPEHPEFGKPEHVEPMENKDHPCLKGCIDVLCKCPSHVPKNGYVLVTHSKSDLVGMGVDLDVNEITAFKKESVILEAWAKSKGMKLYGRNIKGHTQGAKEVFYMFKRPAVNTDFDIPAAI